MPVEVLLDHEVGVSYGQIYVESDLDQIDSSMEEFFRGQANGLCGAVDAGTMFLMTGRHTGRVGFTVERYVVAPELDDGWEDAVEVSFATASEQVGLAEWGGGQWYPLDLGKGEYRVRYCARGMDEARRGGGGLDGEPPLDRYLLQFWPAPPAPDRVLRQTSRSAGYWHDWARALPPPPTEAELAERARLERVAQERRQAEYRAAADRRRWGARLPNDRLREVRGNVAGMEKLDLALVFALAEADDATHRSVARWAVRRAYAAAGLVDLPWVVPALTALDNGEPLPAPFDDFTAVWAYLDDRVPITTVRSYDGRHEQVSQQHAAVPALFGAAEPDSLQSALDALFAAAVTYGDGYPRLFAELRATFPQLKS
jgi:hypothetical protein